MLGYCVVRHAEGQPPIVLVDVENLEEASVGAGEALGFKDGGSNFQRQLVDAGDLELRVVERQRVGRRTATLGDFVANHGDPTPAAEPEDAGGVGLR